MKRGLLIGLGAIGSFGTLLHAGTYHWSSAVSGNWPDAPNWTPIGVPGAVSPIGSPPAPNDDVVIIAATGTPYTVTSDERNVSELRLDSFNLSLTAVPSGGLRTDRLIYKASGSVNLMMNHNGQVEIQSGLTLPAPVRLDSAGSVDFLTNFMPVNMALNMGSAPETAGTPIVLSFPNDPLFVPNVAATGARIWSVQVNSTNGLPAGIDVGGGALYVPTGGYVSFSGPALAEPDFIAGSLYHRGQAHVGVDTLVQNGVFLQGGIIQISSGKTLHTPSLHWGQPGDSPSASTGEIGGTVTLTQPGQAAEVGFGTATFFGTLHGDLNIHSAATMKAAATFDGDVDVQSTATLKFAGTVNGDVHLGSSATLVTYHYDTLPARINSTLTADTNSVIQVGVTDPSQYARLVVNQFVGSATLRLGDFFQNVIPVPGTYPGVLEMVDGDLPPGFVAGLENPRWPGLRMTTQIDPNDAGLLNLILTGTPGDANLSGFIDFDDLLVLASNYGNPNAGWHQGDFNDDHTVGFEDLLALAQHYNQPAMNTDALPAGFAAEWERARTTLPEPTSALVAGALLIVRRSRPLA